VKSHAEVPEWAIARYPGSRSSSIDEKKAPAIANISAW
jgi:hypothetical protein